MKFPAQPQEWKIVSLRDCRTPDMQHRETPDQGAAYWKTHIATYPCFHSEGGCLVVFQMTRGCAFQWNSILPDSENLYPVIGEWLTRSGP
jgi:hypothetical protein